ncbi:class I SAM-dependent methyltransferase [Streptomyces sp. NPDC092952]|uniref:class I SAM-dependent methyltransferase n=1 Tax=Streptomyces sp. NPDC092952 TaxID=3366018 RepID=UPI003821C6CC
MMRISEMAEDDGTGPGPGVQAYYAQSAESLAERYESVSFEQVHAALLDLLPEAPARVLDVGAGTGRDAAALARLGHRVVAVEPVAELRRVAERLHGEEGISWRRGALPELADLDGEFNGGFEAVLLSAVWMHLLPEERPVALRRLAELLAPGGVLLISLRRGEPPQDRRMFDVPADEVAEQGRAAGFEIVRHAGGERDRLGRDDVSWEALALRVTSR